MLINEITIKGFKSFGNNEQTIKLNTEKGELILLTGSNGNGKSLIPSTTIEVNIPIELFTLQDLLYFLEVMGEESSYILYIKEKNIKLYEEYIKYRDK
jgi:hypothetical protein